MTLFLRQILPRAPGPVFRQLGAGFLTACLPFAIQARPPRAPPPAPVPMVRAAPVSATGESPRAAPAETPAGWHSIGDPTDDEQLVLEYINRARTDANAEAMRLYSTTDPDVLSAYEYFVVDLDEMTNQFATLTRAVPPLSFDARLLAAARLHSLDMFTNAFQGHVSSAHPPPPNQPGDDMADRAERQGYAWFQIAENVFAYADSPWQAHAGFEVDWGFDAYGMQVPPGHRQNIHDPAYRDIGIGIVGGRNPPDGSGVGPLIVTEDFARTASPKPFITGVAYYDLNGNGFYDPGEGMGGVTVTSPGSATGAVTAVSGGYSVPVTTNGTYTVTFASAGQPDFTDSVTVTGGANCKLDYTPMYEPPALSGPLLALTGETNAYALQPLAGATNYEALVTRLSTNGFFEGAETGTNGLLINASPGYAVLQSSVVRSGLNAFHFAHPAPPTSQYLEVDRAFYCYGDARLDFGSRLRYATTDQTARVDVAESLDGLAWGPWNPVYAQAGTGDAGESNFTMRNVSLSDRAGRFIRVRVVYAFRSGGYYSGTENHIGWFVDDIALSNVREVAAQEQRTTGTAGLDWSPAADGDYLLQVRGTYGRRTYPWSDPMAATATSLRFRLESIAPDPGGPLRVFVSATGATPTNLWLESAAAAEGPYANVPDLAPTNTAPGLYRFDFTPGDADPHLFLRAAGQ